MSAGFEKIPNIDLTVKAESLEDDLFAVYKRLFPEAVQSDLTFEELVGGYVNCIMRLGDFFFIIATFLSNSSSST